ncbi:MAG TPA: hypothetical protein VFE21_02945 [Rubrobacteraceae bacterium]|nr:hypothetical protein [Rubrobacteraceae bacterium]
MGNGSTTGSVDRCATWRIFHLAHCTSDVLVIGIGGLGSTAAHQRAELRLALLSKATVVVDTLEGVQEEAGDLIQAERAGAFQRDQTARAVFSSC